MEKKEKVFWHALSQEEVIEKLDSDPQNGFSEKEALLRLKKFGENKLEQKRALSRLKIFLHQFASPLIYLLLIVGVIVLFLEDYPQNLLESSFIFLAVGINAIFGFWEENKASKAFENLKKILKTKTVVLREGHKKEILQEKVVPGDILFLSVGDKVPADGRLLEADDLKVSEAILTGEWLPVKKQTGRLPKDTPLADRANMVYAGCLVEAGQGKMVVTATGEETETGKIALLIKQTKEEETPLQKKLSYFATMISGAILALTFLIFLAGLARHKNPLEMFETAAAITVGGIPQALPIVMTLTLAIGMERLARKKGLVRKLASVETLGSTSVICCDKTRTLTWGKMEPDQVFTLKKTYQINPQIKDPLFILALKIAVLANDAFVENPEQELEKWRIKGAPTDRALLLAGKKAKILKPDLEKKLPLLERLPFDSSLKYQASLHKDNKGLFLCLTGAPEKLLSLSDQIQIGEEKRKINSQDKRQILEIMDRLTEEGKRVVALAYREVDSDQKNKKIKRLAKGFIFVGLLSIKDPLRPDVKKAINIAQKAGLRPVIVTGDYRKTVQTIAEELGLKTKEKNILEGSELDKMSDSEFAQKVEKIIIYPRAEPRHKLRIVKAWQEKGEVVAMTGDGVNDSPAIKKADIGLALGSGTEVAKQTSDLVLLDDSFETIVEAVQEGRTILANLRKAIAYILADSFTSVILVGGSILLDWPLPILWTQILWNNIVEDTFPDIAYAFEPKEKEVMERGPVPLKSPLLNKEMKILIFVTGFIDQLVILVFFFILWGKFGLPLDYVRTMTFGTICLDTAFVIYSYKNLTKNIWRVNLFDNKFLLASSLIVFLAFAAAIYLPPLQALLGTVPLGPGSWLLIISMAILSMSLIELTKWFFICRES